MKTPTPSSRTPSCHQVIRCERFVKFVKLDLRTCTSDEKSLAYAAITTSAKAMRRLIPILAILTLLSGCATVISSVGGRLADNMSVAILNQDDPETVRQGATTLLLVLDSFIIDNPEDPSLLLSGSKLYGAYSGFFVKDPVRAKRLAGKAKDYADRALCLQLPAICAVRNEPFETFQAALAGVDKQDVPVLYGFAAAWAGWIQVNTDDWSAIAQLPKVQSVMRRVVALDETYDGGSAHLYLGVLDTQLPPSLGGKPEEGRRHFERASALSGGLNLMPKVLMAERYARLTYNEELHQHLLQEVLDAPTHAPGYTLINTLAQERARELLASAHEYF